MFQKSVSVSKFSTSTNFITIYRWGQLALDLPNNHELTFLVWQKFFLRYFHRVSEYVLFFSVLLLSISKKMCIEVLLLIVSVIKQHSTLVWQVGFLKE